MRRREIRKKAAAVLLLMITGAGAGCAAVSPTAENDSPESVYAEDKNADFLYTKIPCISMRRMWNGS